MNSLIPTLWGLLRLKAGPQDLPASWPLTGLVLAIYFAEGILTSQSLGEENGAARVILSGVMQIAAVVILLNIFDFTARLQQTLLALAGTGVILGLLFFALLTQVDGTTKPFMALVLLGLIGWSVAVDANIYRHSLSVKFSTGILITVLLFAVTYMLDYFIFL